ncbi:LuxR C-terminal-related transcriptional regulator [Kitasatospora sp. NPDC059577]|uniref:LuxR C-terminal-related transcriptional regulator n=1 Tax=Kitasatospora sp. NPDC059577 TaxID=3346873 RepID=UPI0036D147E0
MTDEPGQAERALYLAVVRGGGRLCPEHLAPADRPAFAALVARGLLTTTPTGWTAASPRALGDRLGSELRSRATRLLQHAERLPDALAPLALAYDAVRRPHGPDGDAVHLDGNADIRQHISELVSECQEEVLAAQPGPRPVDGLRMALAQDLSLLRRGCSLRTLYQPAALVDHTVQRQVALRTRQGARVRLLAEPYERLLVFDRKAAVIPAAEDRSRATVLTDPAVVAHLVAHFERDWARATPADHHLDPPHPTTVRVGRLLARGLTQRAVATRLGLSERTVAAHISRLRDRHGARTLFHLGWRLRGERRD